VFSEAHANAACNFFELVLKHTADDWYGKPFILYPAEEDAVRAIFGNLDEHGNRLIEMAYLEWPKKSGKTEFAAGLVLLALILDPMPGCQVYGAASAQRQAGNVYRAACKMTEQSPILKRELRILRGTNRIMKRSDPESFYAAIAADGDITDGVNPNFVVADEVHRWKTRKQIENWDVLALGGITRRQTLMLAITTAGVQNESPLAWRLHEKTKRILDGVVTDEHFYGQLWGADPKADWRDEKTWIAANPSLKENGGFLELSKLRKYYQDTLSEPDGETSFRRYFLNLWDQKEHRAIDMKLWHACPRDWQASGWPFEHEVLKLFVDRKCWVGIDLSLTTDFSAVSFVFPRDDGGYDVLPFCWLPDAKIREREIHDGMPYRRWAEEGWLELSPGPLIDYASIRARLKWGAEMFDVQEFCFDRCNSREMSTQLVEAGLTCVEIPQNFTGLNEGTKKLLKLVVGAQLHHGGHPVLGWNASCLCLKSDDNDLVRPIKPDRERETARIDLIAATIDALSRAIVAEEATMEYTGMRAVGA
jgi:phage terminase large subunit-like protein